MQSLVKFGKAAYEWYAGKKIPCGLARAGARLVYPGNLAEWLSALPAGLEQGMQARCLAEARKSGFRDGPIAYCTTSSMPSIPFSRWLAKKSSLFLQ